MIGSLQKIDASCDRLLQASASQYMCIQVEHRAVNSIRDRLINEKTIIRKADGRYVPATNKNGKKDSLTSEETCCLAYDYSASYQMLESLLASEKVSVAKFVRSFRTEILAGDMLLPLINARCILEHAALLYRLIKDLKPVIVPVSVSEAMDAIGNIYELVGKKLYATRVDWLGIAASPDNCMDWEDKLKYSPKENRFDMEAKGLMNAIDHLDKQVKGARALYEVLCEFAHPNVGNLLINRTGSATCKSDKMGVPWVHTSIGMEPPTALISPMLWLFSKLMKLIADIICHFEELINIDGPQQSEKILEINQIVMRDVVSKNRDSFDPYCLCPCGSGKKLRFCCQSA
ncbi:MAG: hypothetical protein WC340_04750 [Kiritimatiellia bacterium]